MRLEGGAGGFEDKGGAIGEVEMFADCSDFGWFSVKKLMDKVASGTGIEDDLD